MPIPSHIRAAADWANRDGRWLLIDDIPPLGRLELALTHIDENPSGYFWG